MSRCQHSSLTHGEAVLCNVCWGDKGSHRAAAAAARLEGFSVVPGSPDLQWAAAADPNWCWVDLSWPLRGEAARPSLFHPAVCAQVGQLHCTDLLHCMYFCLI